MNTEDGALSQAATNKDSDMGKNGIQENVLQPSSSIECALKVNPTMALLHNDGPLTDCVEFAKPSKPVGKKRGPKKRNKGGRKGVFNSDHPFRCDLCSTSYVTSPMRRGNRGKATRYVASPRRKVDPITKKVLILCNACGLAFGRPKKASKMKEKATDEEIHDQILMTKAFAKKLAEDLNEPCVENLICTYRTSQLCNCIHQYICSDDEQPSINERAKKLIDLTKKAAELRKKKCYEVYGNEASPSSKKRSVYHIGLGNGLRKSKEFEDFVLDNRKDLRDIFGFCEKGTQRILQYSNNFLHKRLKTDPAKPIRADRKKGKAVLGKLIPIHDLQGEQCCVDNCVLMSLTHAKLLQQWRDRAAQGQAEARRVLGEMLTPSGGNRCNCYRFVSWVTGCSNSTIGKVNEQMKETGGDREPPQHGLIQWWKDHPKPKKPKAKLKQQTAVSLSSQDNAPTMPLFPTAAFVQPLSILQAAANSAGLTAVMQPQSIQQETHQTLQPQQPPQPQATHIQQQQQQQLPIVVLQTLDPQQQSKVNSLQQTIGLQSNDSNLHTGSTFVTLNGAIFNQPGMIAIPNVVSNSLGISGSPIQIQTIQQLQQQQQLTQIHILQQQQQQQQQQAFPQQSYTLSLSPSILAALQNQAITSVPSMAVFSSASTTPTGITVIPATASASTSHLPVSSFTLGTNLQSVITTRAANTNGLTTELSNVQLQGQEQVVLNTNNNGESVILSTINETEQVVTVPQISSTTDNFHTDNLLNDTAGYTIIDASTIGQSSQSNSVSPQTSSSVVTSQELQAIKLFTGGSII